MRKYGVILLTLFTVNGCTTSKQTAEIKYDNFIKAAKIIKEPDKPVKLLPVPKVLPLPGQLKKKGKPRKRQTNMKRKSKLSLKKSIEQARNKAKRIPEADGYINAIQVYPYTNGALYTLYGAINQVSDIALQPGEQLISVSAGDTSRWIVGDTKSGQGKDEQVHILVKPTAGDLQTNLIVTTDRRTYYLDLVSDNKTYISSISWTYPHDELITLKEKNRKAEILENATIGTDIRLKNLNFRYRIKGSAPWRPVRVFDDSKKVYIKFPSGLSQGEAPPLFILGSKGKPALVNYRVKGTYYIVDRLFAAAELRLGEEPQNIVRIVRRDAVWK